MSRLRSCSKCGRIHADNYVCIKRKTDNSRADNKIYNTRQWKSVRASVLDSCNNLCLWSYYIRSEIVEANTVHHIVEVLDQEQLAYEEDNLIALEEYAHKFIHVLYKDNKHKYQELLKQLKEEWTKGNKNIGCFAYIIKEI